MALTLIPSFAGNGDATGYPGGALELVPWCDTGKPGVHLSRVDFVAWMLMIC